MKIFTCESCYSLVFFENTFCAKCKHQLGFFFNDLIIHTLNPVENYRYKINTKPGKTYRYCLNYTYGVCNWMVDDNSPEIFCKACQHNRIIPNLQEPKFAERWAKVEVAKHRLIYQLLRLELPLTTKTKNNTEGLMFDFMADTDADKEIMTGHDKGLITLNMAEADDVERELARRKMQEAYRTVLGHFRHEIGHYYWDRLIDNAHNLGGYRGLFGDERLNYQQALDKHYQTGAPENWQNEYISAYATMHPWEDWAETWAHYMHIMDTLETVWAMGISVQPGQNVQPFVFNTHVNTDPYTIPNFYTLFEWWLPVAMSFNAVSRSMGQPDLYPFIIPPKVADKLAFIHTLVKRVN